MYGRTQQLFCEKKIVFIFRPQLKLYSVTEKIKKKLFNHG